MPVRTVAIGGTAVFCGVCRVDQALRRQARDAAIQDEDFRGEAPCGHGCPSAMLRDQLALLVFAVRLPVSWLGFVSRIPSASAASVTRAARAGIGLTRDTVVVCIEAVRIVARTAMAQEEVLRIGLGSKVRAVVIGGVCRRSSEEEQSETDPNEKSKKRDGCSLRVKPAVNHSTYSRSPLGLTCIAMLTASG